MSKIKQYKGIEIRAAAGIHEEAIAVIKNLLSPGSLVLDIAAGRGAFAARLQDEGFVVEANEIDEAAFSPLDIKCNTIDLNYPFAKSFGLSKFNMIVAIEVIEHLNNPIMFLKECYDMLIPNGYLLVTTPNILDKFSRIKFLRRGQFCHFEPVSFYKTGHRTIMPKWLLELYFNYAGFIVQKTKYIGDKPKVEWTRIRSVLNTVIASVLSIFMMQSQEGELTRNCIMFLLEKTEVPQKR